MRGKWSWGVVCLALCLALGLAAWAQEAGEGRGGPLVDLGPSAQAVTDSQGWFFAELVDPFPLGVRGQLGGPRGDPLAGFEVTVVLEPRAGIPQILGIGNVAALWLVVTGYDPARIAGFTIVTGPRLVLEIGSVALAPSPACATGAYEFQLTKDEEDRVAFRYRYCDGGTWGSWVLSARWATKHASPPEKADKLCTWIVVTSVEAGRMSYTFYHSDGEKWDNRGTVVIQVVTHTSSPCIPCSYVHVEPMDWLHITYHCDTTGKWVEIGRWETPAPEPEPGPPVIIIP